MNAHVSAPATAPEDIDEAMFRFALGRFVTGVAVMTTKSDDGANVGVTVSSFNTLSLDPPLILWSLSLKAPSLAHFRAAKRFGVNILASDQRDLALRFARPARDKFADVRVSEGAHGAPLIHGAVVHLECGVEVRHPGGDHELIIGRILKASVNEKAPLVFGHGRFGHFAIPAAED
jgi:flavin reductase (DIM6/NTAB) family NADH-FMN oxidoreductase RutF